MKTRVLALCVALAGLFLSACKKNESAPDSAQAQSSTAAAETPPATVPAGPTETETKLAEQIREMETRQAEMELQMEEERLAATEAEIARERDLLAKERKAWRLELELAEAKAALPAGESQTVVPVVASGVSDSPQNYDYQMFYDELAPLGSWFESPDYGYVWQPSICVSDESWRPYTHGRWVCSDLGWTWCSDEPFGWACYHYGRWVRLHGIGWVWLPGDQWAPAWVAWRRNEKYVGWCPLPPETVYDHDCTYGDTIDTDCGIDPGCYVFVPVRHFDEPVPGYCEAASICLTICHTTVNITNIIVRPGRVECSGPRYEWIRECVRRPVPRYTLACDFERREHGRGSGHRIEKDRIHCFAPGVRAPWNAGLRPSRTAASVAGAEVVRGENGLPGKLAARFKQERKRREETAQNPGGASGKMLAERQQRLADLEKTREALHEKLRLESDAARVAAKTEASGGKLANTQGREGKFANRSGSPREGAAERPQNDKRMIAPIRVESSAARPGGNDAAVATPAPAARPTTAPAIGPAAHPSRVASENSRLAAARAELARLRAERDAAAKTGAEQPSQDAVAVKNDKRGIVSRVGEEATRQPQENPPKELATDQSARKLAASEPQHRDSRDAAHHEAAEKQSSAQAALEERRRQLEARKEQAAQERAAIEQQRRGETANQSRRDEIADARESEKQNTARAADDERRRQMQQQAVRDAAAKQEAAQDRAAMDQQKRQADAETRAERLSEQRAAVEQRRRQAEAESRSEQAQRQREAVEQQRRQAEAESRAEQAHRQREAMEQQRRQAEAESRAEQAQRQREAAEQQRRQAEAESRAEQAQRQREAAEQQRRQAEAESRAEQALRQREAMEQQRHQAEEQNRRQAEEQNRRQADEQRARESSEREGKGRR